MSRVTGLLSGLQYWVRRNSSSEGPRCAESKGPEWPRSHGSELNDFTALPRVARHGGAQWSAFPAIPMRGDPRRARNASSGSRRSIIGQPRLGTVDGPDFHLCKASLILHPATYMQRLILFLHFFGPDKTLRAILDDTRRQKTGLRTGLPPGSRHFERPVRPRIRIALPTNASLVRPARARWLLRC